VKAVFLAAGFATRMYPLTRERAKPLLEVGGEALLTRLLRQALAAGVDEVAVVVNARFESDFHAWSETVECSVPLHVVANGAREDHELRGAVADLALAMEHAFPEGSPGGYLVGAADNLLGFALRPFAEQFREHDAPLLLVRETPPPVPPRTYSDVAVGEDGRVTAFREKPEDPRGGHSAIGLYFLPADLQLRVSDYLAAGGNPDAPGHFLAWLCDQTEVYAAPITGPWYDVGSLEGYRAVREGFAPS